MAKGRLKKCYYMYEGQDEEKPRGRKVGFWSSCLVMKVGARQGNG